MNKKIIVDFESVFGKLEKVNVDVLQNAMVYIRFFKSKKVYNQIKSLLPDVGLQKYSNNIYYILVEK